MEIGVTLRLMGRAATRASVLACAQHAERSGIDALWVPDHIAIPPDDAEGSDGRYLDALTSLAWLAAATARIGLGTGVLVLPYRRALPTAKAIATIQELSEGRLRVGAGVGWMDVEFRALGLDRSQRGRAADAALDVLRRCFDAPDDIVVEHGQPFYFRPRPARPPILIGGRPPHALARAARFGDGWMPMGADPDVLAPAIAELRERFAAAGRGAPQVVAFGALAADAARAEAQLGALETAGVTGFVHGLRYASPDEFARGIEPAAEQVARRA